MDNSLRIGLVVSALMAATLTNQAQAAFGNLDFESATVVSHDDNFGFLDWALAVPGWTHGEGPDTRAVYRGLTHVGTTPWYLLVDAAVQGRAPLQGSYSVAFASGHSDPQSENSPWIESFMAQQGTVPVSVRSIRFLASGSFEFRVNGAALPVLSLGQGAYGADLSAYAGQSVELRFANVSTQLHDAVVVDDVRLSSMALVPEPATGILGIAGLGWLALAMRRTAPHQLSA